MVKTDRTMMVWQAFGDTAQAFGNFIFLCVFDRVIRQHYCGSPSDNSNHEVISGRGNYFDDSREDVITESLQS